MSISHSYLKIAAVFGLTGVMAGAFGAHALNDMLSAQQMDWWKTASFYHLVHSLLLVGIAFAITPSSSKWFLRAFSSTAFGILFFCGSLYVMATTEIRWVAFLTPVGGLGLILGWICLFMVSKNLLPKRSRHNKDDADE